LSAIHVALEMKYPAKMASLTKAYKAIRDSMFAKYRKDSAESGVKFVEGSSLAQLQHQQLFNMNITPIAGYNETYAEKKVSISFCTVGGQ
jgi:hypothetical protein